MGWFWGRKFFDTYLNGDVTYGYQAVSIDERRRRFSVSLWDESRKNEGQMIEQVWFSGFHSDVGGSHADAGLSDIALKWMLDKAQHRGLRLRQRWMDSLRPDPSGRIHRSREGLCRLWPPAVRRIPESAKIHASVLRRMDNLANVYRPGNLPAKYLVVD